MNSVKTSVEQLLTRFNEGALDETMRLAQEAVRANPGDTTVRALLAELLCFQAQFDKADQHLDIAVQLDPSSAVGIAQFRQIVRAAAARQDFFDHGTIPSFFSEPTDELQSRLRAALAFREERFADAVEQLERAEAQRVHPTGQYDGRTFDDLRDLDDVIGSVLELLTADGRYFWVPFEQVGELVFEPPRRSLDLLFRQVRVATKDGTEGVMFAPTLYDGSARSPNPSLRLGRATDWVKRDGAPVRGLGQRMWLAGDSDLAMMDVTRITFQ
jgi:type VI secretion system protein ImpE